MVDWTTCEDPCEHCKTDAHGRVTEERCPGCGQRSEGEEMCPTCIAMGKENK